tara:strand:+ start:166 stop:324 length:159 start_codon:yes stop_codon:yes gene_type:complete
MRSEDIGFIFLYVGAFGFSDYIVRYLNLDGSKYILYYSVILLIGILLLSKIN